MPPSVTQKISVGEELLTAVRLYSSGLGQLQSLDDGASDFFHLPLLALQQGLERWVKISLCFLYLEHNGEFPDESYFPRGRQGHNIQPLLDKLLSLAYTSDFENKFPDLKRDHDFLNSKHFREYLCYLGDFGMSSRYFHLNMVLNSKFPFNPPDHIWQDIQGKILDYNLELKKAFEISNGSQEIVLQVLAESHGILVCCGRSLARLLVWGALGEKAKEYYGYVHKFFQLSNEELITVKFEPFHKNV